MVKPKKHLGQHFLHDKNIARKVAESLTGYGNYKKVLEVGPGTGSLTQFLLQNKSFETWVIEIDHESVEYLSQHYTELQDRIIAKDFLKINLPDLFREQIAITGNFPYNISTQILFKALEHREMVPEFTGMFQKEVAERIAEPPGTKTYGIMSVLVQAFYKVEYLFTVSETVFYPPPKVKSAVIRLQRKEDRNLNCDEALFFKVVKTCFNQRRKTIRNSIRSLNPKLLNHPLFDKRPEQLSVSQFAEITRFISENE